MGVNEDFGMSLSGSAMARRAGRAVRRSSAGQRRCWWHRPATRRWRRGRAGRPSARAAGCYGLITVSSRSM